MRKDSPKMMFTYYIFTSYIYIYIYIYEKRLPEDDVNTSQHVGVYL